jgi:hypothetical protein
LDEKLSGKSLKKQGSSGSVASATSAVRNSMAKASSMAAKIAELRKKNPLMSG